MSRRGSGAGAVALLIAALVLGTALLLSLAAGAGVYRRIQDRGEQDGTQRLGLGYLTAKLRAHDAAGSVEPGRFGSSDALFLRQDMDGAEYETVLYVHEGFLKELFRLRGRELGPEDGQEITEARELRVFQEGDLLVLRYTDAAGLTETTNIYVRSGLS